MSYLKIPLSPAVNGQTSVVIQKKDILNVLAVAGGQSTIINMNSSVGAEDVLTLTHTAPAQAGTPAGSTQSYNVADVIQDAWVSNPGSIVSVIGGIPATQSATNQALTFVQFSAAVFS
tara:strand:- start:65 stop:418 length:354 start_codon:yes stop_codon:yes gene_type:complete